MLDSSGTHTVLVRDAGASTGGYTLAIQRLADPVGCSAKSFATAAERGVVTTTGETDCWRFDGLAGQPVRLSAVRTAGALSPTVEVVRPSGTTRCGPSPADALTCRLDVGGRHTILVRDGAGPALGEYRLGLQRLIDPVGCSSRAYGTGVTATALATTGETGCWRFTGGGADRVRLRVVATSGAWSPIAEVLHSSGSTTCAPRGGTSDCELEESGVHTILLRDSLGTRTGGYRISIQRLNDPVGCEDEPGSAGVDGSAVVAGIGCWRLDGDTGDLMRIRVVDTGSGSDATTEVVRPDGSTVCNLSTRDSETCELDADGAHAILVQGSSSGSYRIATIQLNDPFYNCATWRPPLQPIRPRSTTARRWTATRPGRPRAGMRSLRVEATSGTLQPVVEILRPDGTLRCRMTAPDGWFDCYGDIYEYHRVLVYDASGRGHGDYEIDRR